MPKMECFMKTIFEYLSIAWKNLRKLWKKALVIMLNTFIIALINCSLIVLVASPLRGTGRETTFLFVVMTIVLCLNGTLLYYLPNWYLNLLRKDEVSIAPKRFGRALMVSLIMMSVPFLAEVVCGVVLGWAELYSYPMWSMVVVMVSLAIFLIWWNYAVCLFLPYVALDREDLSVWGAVKETLRLSDGHKLQLLGMDLLIGVVPVIILLVLVVLNICPWPFSLSELGSDLSEDSALFESLSIIIVILLFVFLPLMLLARAIYYEDIRNLR